MEGGERFWSALFAAIIVAGETAKKLGLIHYDIAHIRHWLLTVQLPRMRGVVTTEFATPLSTLTDYIETISAHILITTERPGVLGFPVQAVHGALLGHYDKYTGQLHLLKKGFRDYCLKQRGNPTKILEELWANKLDADGVQRRVVSNKSVKKTLGAGTEFAKAQSWCITIDMTHPEMAGLVEVASTPADQQVKSPPKGKLSLVEE
jgi:hypothetical protein